MRLLLDENISFRVIKSIAEYFPESKHVSSIWKTASEDLEIFEFSKSNDFSIVTFDEDFYDIQLLKGFPPKIIWLRFGNSNNRVVADKLINNCEKIIRFNSDPDLGLLEIY